MSQLPCSVAATAEDRKITQYLLDSAHPIGGAGKAKFFRRKQIGRISRRRCSTTDHARTNSLTEQITTQYGEKYEVSCSLTTPEVAILVSSRYGLSSRSTNIRGLLPLTLPGPKQNYAGKPRAVTVTPGALPGYRQGQWREIQPYGWQLAGM